MFCRFGFESSRVSRVSSLALRAVKLTLARRSLFAFSKWPASSNLAQ